MNYTDTLPKTLAQVEAERGLITLKAVYKNAGGFTVCPVKDPQRPGFYLGVEKLSDEEKRKREYYIEPEKLSLKLKDGKEFDLSKEVDYLNWMWVKHVPEIKMSFEEAQKSNYEVRFYVKIEEVESQKTLSRLQLKLQAMNLVEADEPLNYSARARLLGVDLRGQSLLAQKEFIMTEAERDPARVLNVYNSDSLGIKLLVLNALDKNIIQYDQRIYSYNTVTLGMNEDAVVEFLTRAVNRPVRDLIEKELAYVTGPDNAQVAKEAKAAERPTVNTTTTETVEAVTAVTAEAANPTTITSAPKTRPRGGHKKD